MFNWKIIILNIPIFIIIIDITDYFFPNGELIYLRSAFLFFVFFTFLIKYNNIYLDKVYKSFLIFYFYIFFVSLINSSDLNITLTGNLSIFINTSYYLVALNIFKTQHDIEKFRYWFVSIPLLFLINLIIFTGFKIGEPVYGAENSIRVGNLHHSRIYVGSLVVILSLVFAKYSNNKIRDIVLIGTLIIILMLSMRRTALLIIIVSSVIYLISNRNLRVFKYFIFIFIFIALSYPLYEKQLSDIIEKRSSRIETTEDVLEEETRYLEVVAVTEKIFSFKNMTYSLFGTEFLNSFGTYSTEEIKMPSDRILHTDYAVILHGAGLIGLLFYINFILSIFLRMYNWILKKGLKNDISILYLMLLSSLIIVTISGSILNITFRTFFFIILGALNGFTINCISTRNKIYETSFNY